MNTNQNTDRDMAEAATVILTREGAVIVEPWDPLYREKELRIAPDPLPSSILPVGEPFSRIWYDGNSDSGSIRFGIHPISDLGFIRFGIWDSSDLGFGISDFGFKGKEYDAYLDAFLHKYGGASILRKTSYAGQERHP